MEEGRLGELVFCIYRIILTFNILILRFCQNTENTTETSDKINTLNLLITIAELY